MLFSALINLELQGLYEKLATLLADHAALSEEPLLLSSARRAAAMSGRPDLVQKFDQTPLADLNSTSTQARELMYQAWKARRASAWQESIDLCEKVSTLTLANEESFLKPDAAYGAAISYAELGRPFVALDVFLEIAKNPHASLFRRDLAQFNAALLMWDLSLLRDFKDATSKLPAEFTLRLKIFDSMASGDTLWMEFLDPQTWPREFNGSEQLSTAQALIEAAVVWDRGKLDDLRKSAEFQSILKAHSQDGAYLRWLKHSLSYLLGTSGTRPDAPVFLSWRQRIESIYLDLLSDLSQGKHQIAKAKWLSKLNPALNQSWLKNPLLPTLEMHGFSLQNPWTERLSSLLKLENPAKFEPRFILRDCSLSYISSPGDAHSIDFSKSPTSAKLLRILANSKCSRISKRELHEQLTASKYSAHIHDARILKLLKRVEQRIDAEGLPPLWRIRRDNHIHLNMEFHLRFD